MPKNRAKQVDSSSLRRHKKFIFMGPQMNDRAQIPQLLFDPGNVEVDGQIIGHLGHAGDLQTGLTANELRERAIDASMAGRRFLLMYAKLVELQDALEGVSSETAR